MKKKKLNKQQEFELFKLVLDKFLWIGVVVMLFGFYHLAFKSEVVNGLIPLVAGAIILVLFIWVLARSYEMSR